MQVSSHRGVWIVRKSNNHFKRTSNIKFHIRLAQWAIDMSFYNTILFDTYRKVVNIEQRWQLILIELKAQSLLRATYNSTIYMILVLIQRLLQKSIEQAICISLKRKINFTRFNKRLTVIWYGFVQAHRNKVQNSIQTTRNYGSSISYIMSWVNYKL